MFWYVGEVSIPKQTLASLVLRNYAKRSISTRSRKTRDTRD